MRKDSVNIEGNTPLFQKTRWALKQGNVIVKIALFVGSERRDAPLACLSQCALLKREVYDFQVSSAGTNIRFFINPVQDNRVFQAADFVGQAMLGSENISIECHRNSGDSKVVCTTRRYKMVVRWESQTRYVYLTDCAQNDGVKLVELVDSRYASVGLGEMLQSKFGFGRNFIGRFLSGYLSMEEKHQDYDILGLLCTTICVHQVVVDDNLFVRRR
jgi:hypothetical protein